MHVVLVLCDHKGTDERVSVTLHCLHDDVLALADLMPCATLVRDLALRRLRNLLCALEGVRHGPQRDLERAQAAAAKHGVRQSLRAVVSPILYHDACTLFAALIFTATGMPSWITLADACRCGDNAWGVTCTPPRVSKHRLCRDALDECVAFCWTCLARHEPRRVFKHMAPQKSV